MGKTLIEMRADLRTDLKDPAALWSDPELDRSVEKAVSDLSRFLPMEKIYEVTVDYEVAAEAFTTPAAASEDAIVADENIATISDGHTCDNLVDRVPDVPRPVAILLTDADESITAFTIIVKGTDENGSYITESFHLSGGLSQVGKKYFKTIVEVEFAHIAGNGSGDRLDVGTTNAYDSYVYLDNKPIKPNSETISGKTRDTDYIMDYANGGIKYINGGSMAAGTAYTIKYEKSQISIDLSPIKDDFIRLDRVEYAAGKVPQEFITSEIHAGVLTITGDLESQKEMTAKEHMAIYYHARHSPPSAEAPGSYPSFLDNTVILAASAYALFIEALQYEQQAVTDLASVRTELGYCGGADGISAIHALVDSALDKVDIYVIGSMADALTAAAGQYAKANVALTAITGSGIHGLATAAFGRAAALLVDTSGEIDAALIKVATYLEPIDTQNNAADVLAEIHDMEAYLRDLIVKLSDGSGALKDANTYLAEVDTTDLGQATVGAEGLLETGDDKINTVNLGSNVPENYAIYSGARVAIANARISAALGFLREAELRLATVRSYIEESAGWVRIGETFIAEASQHVAAANAAITEGSGRVAQLGGYVAEAMQRVNAGNGYVAEAEGRLGMVRAFIDEANSRIAEINNHLAEAAQYQLTAGADMALADKFRAEAIERRNEAWAIWRDPSQYIGDFSISPVRQPSQ